MNACNRTALFVISGNLMTRGRVAAFRFLRTQLRHKGQRSHDIQGLERHDTTIFLRRTRGNLISVIRLTRTHVHNIKFITVTYREYPFPADVLRRSNEASSPVRLAFPSVAVPAPARGPSATFSWRFRQVSVFGRFSPVFFVCPLCDGAVFIFLLSVSCFFHTSIFACHVSAA